MFPCPGTWQCAGKESDWRGAALGAGRAGCVAGRGGGPMGRAARCRVPGVGAVPGPNGGEEHHQKWYSDHASWRLGIWPAIGPEHLRRIAGVPLGGGPRRGGDSGMAVLTRRENSPQPDTASKRLGVFVVTRRHLVVAGVWGVLLVLALVGRDRGARLRPGGRRHDRGDRLRRPPLPPGEAPAVVHGAHRLHALCRRRRRPRRPAHARCPHRAPLAHPGSHRAAGLRDPGRGADRHHPGPHRVDSATASASSTTASSPRSPCSPARSCT